MPTRLFSTLVVSSTIVVAGIGFAIATLPARADDDIETKARMCNVCHGQNGVPADSKNVPIIWGQQQSYLMKQLHDYRSGDRDNAIMSAMAKGLAQEDLRKIAAYFAAKSWPAHQGGAPSTPEPAGLSQCQPCHQPKFEGGAPAPRLAGLSYEYMVTQMRHFANGERSNNGDMPKLMQMHSDSDRDAMAHYLSGL